MGFGLLFFGYFFTFSVPFKGVDLLPDIAGCILMFIALGKLCGYCPENRGFKYARLTLYPYAVIAALFLLYQLGGLVFTIPESVENYFITPLSTVYSVIIGVYQVFLLIGIYRLSDDVELPKPAARARRLLVLTAVYYLAELLAYTGVLEFLSSKAEAPDIVLSYINMALFAIGFLWFVLMWALIFTCYMRICLEGDENMPYREDFTDRIRKSIKTKVDELNAEPETDGKNKKTKKK